MSQETEYANQRQNGAPEAQYIGPELSSPLIDSESDTMLDSSKIRKLSKSASPHSPQARLPSPKLRRSARKASHPKPVIEERKTVPVRRAPRKSKWDAETIITDPKSPLAKADLRKLLLHPSAWHVLDEKEKAEIIALFPDERHILSARTPEARPDTLSLQNDDAFRSDCAAYVQHVAEGQFDPQWLESAWSAHERRRMGDFDGVLNRKFERDWGVGLPQELEHRRAQPKEELKVKLDASIVNGRIVHPDDNGHVQAEACGKSKSRQFHSEANAQETEDITTNITAESITTKQAGTEKQVD